MAEQNVQKQEAATPVNVERTESRPVYSPRVDIIEKKEALVLKADMPGVAQNGVDVLFEQGVLTIRGRVGDQKPEGEPLVTEYGVGDFERSFTVSDDIDAGKIDAVLKDGVLTLTLPKAESAKPQKIRIKTA